MSTLTLKEIQNINTSGFEKIQFFPEAALQHIDEFASGLFNQTESPEPYHVSMLSDDIGYRKKAYYFLQQQMAKYIAEILPEYEILCANFIVKPVHSGKFTLHQNWTFVDEIQSRSFTIWIPLTDCDEKNGTLFFLKGSHIGFRRILRGSGLPYFHSSYEESIKQKCLPVNVRRGEAILLDDAIFHFSPNNQSNLPRVALQFTCVKKETPTFHIALKKSWLFNSLYLTKTNAEWYISRNQNPSFSQRISYRLPKISEHSFWSILEQSPDLPVHLQKFVY